MSHLTSGFETVIGLEVHVQLKTASKVFAPAPSAFERDAATGELRFRPDTGPNRRVDPVVLGLPGALPVLNKEAVEQSVRFALLVGGRVPDASNWVRKNYFYPDSPKNYQISQFAHDAIALGGRVEIELPGPSRNVMGEHKFIGLDHAHLEEDVGKLSHTGSGSLVDYNRAGTPLLEIVTAPDLRSADEAVAFLNALRMMLSQAGISDCDMEKGQMRCDVNVSIRKPGEPYGTRTEMKNLNSVSGVRAGIEYEVARQIREVTAGRVISQETRGWNAAEGRNYLLRSKENSDDYRYFPDPDLLPVRVSPERQAALAAEIPERPFDRQRRYMETYALPYTVTSVLIPDIELAQFFETAVAAHPKNPQGVANILVNDLLGALAAANAGRACVTDTAVSEATEDDIYGSLADADASPNSQLSPITFAAFTSKITPAHIAGLVSIIDSGTLSKQQSKEIVLPEMLATGQTADAVVAARGLAQSNDTGEIEALIREVLALPTSAKPIAEFKAGNEKALNSLKGPVMKKSGGKANPAVVDELVRKLIDLL